VKLKAYRELRRLTQADVAEQLGTDQVNVCRWEDGTIPRPDMVRKIRNWSGGAVTAEDFYSCEVEE
jgi:transcriptional regulator with XRE-family HTH domain